MFSLQVQAHPLLPVPNTGLASQVQNQGLHPARCARRAQRGDNPGATRDGIRPPGQSASCQRALLLLLPPAPLLLPRGHPSDGARDFCCHQHHCWQRLQRAGPGVGLPVLQPHHQRDQHQHHGPGGGQAGDLSHPGLPDSRHTAVPGLPAVRLRGHLPVRVLHQGLHDGGGAADPHLRAQTFIDICKGLPQTNLASLVYALASAVLLIVVKELNLKYMKKIRMPIPMEIIIVIVATAVSGSFNMPDKYGMPIVGKISMGFPQPTLPLVSKWKDMVGTAFSLAIVGYVINLAMGRTLAAKHGYDVDPNQEMLALGCSNFFGSFFKIHVICCALSVTLAVDGAGAKSQVASFFVALVVMVTMLSLGIYLEPLPKSVLGALIAVNLKNSLKQLADPFYLWKKSKLDCLVWLVSFLSAFFLSLPYGVAVGVGFSVLVVVFHTQFRNGSALGQVTSTDIYKNPKTYNKVHEINGIKIVTYCSPLYFANSEIFREKIIAKTGVDPGKVYLARRKFVKQQAKGTAQPPAKLPKFLLKESKTLSLQELQKDFESASPTDTNNNQTTANGASISYITFHPPAQGTGLGQSPGELGSSSSTFTDPVLTAPPYISFHTIILDMSGVCFVDLMGTKALSKLCSSYQKIGIKVFLANVHAQVYNDISTGGVFEEGGLDRSHIFLTIHDAVLFALASIREFVHPPILEERQTQTELSIYDESVDESSAEYRNLEEEMFGSMFHSESQTAL
ncbi:solute carrier family 26 member 9 isoform X2 [Parus major]|uniref:solute carrier family 26 member 9 isoform X2 n=1 Tax=Parus major TaxID=9157 RepID=UPI0007712364|nr:solute carrier family 26 member 9 isoform X2 [Parus major]